MNRRAFLKHSGAAAAAGWLGPGATVSGGSAPYFSGPPNPSALIMDAMGELRPIYEPPLVREMLASGIDSITVTLCDPKAEGGGGTGARRRRPDGIRPLPRDPPRPVRQGNVRRPHRRGA